ncbi:MAG: protease HtpX [Patescibacteria group bacterium]|nr:MAG: protease HtpX [Patescibacteria group bacterium]
MQNIYEATSANKRKSFLVVVFFLAFVSLASYFIVSALSYYWGYEASGLGIFGIALIISGFTTFIGYFFSDKIILTISNAHPADRNQDFEFYTVAENLSLVAGLPKPKLYIIEDSAPNAFATGRNPENAVVCVTRGLLEKLNRTELEGVIAHELSHIKNYDMLLMSIVAVLVGSISLLADIFLRTSFYRGNREEKNGIQSLVIILGILFAIVSPIIAQLIKLAISRRREFLADASAVMITKQPSGLISALRKISSDYEPLEVANKATAHLFVVSPFKGKGHRAVDWFSGLFNTHPPIEKRIEVLEKMI